MPESRQRAQPLLSTSLRLRLRATYAVKLLGLCGPTHCVPAALRSDKRPQVRARSCCTLRCSSQPQELAVAGVGGQYQIRVRDSFCVELIAVSQGTVLTSSQFRHNSGRPADPSRLAAPVARGSGCGQCCRRTALLRALTCHRLSERSGVAAQRVGRHRSLNCVTQVCPERSAGTQTIGSPFLWVLTFGRRSGGEAKESTSADGPRPVFCRRRHSGNFFDSRKSRKHIDLKPIRLEFHRFEGDGDGLFAK